MDIHILNQLNQKTVGSAAANGFRFALTIVKAGKSG